MGAANRVVLVRVDIVVNRLSSKVDVGDGTRDLGVLDEGATAAWTKAKPRACER